jgi:hypothetical protein
MQEDGGGAEPRPCPKHVGRSGLSGARPPSLLRAFFLRMRGRRGKHVAASATRPQKLAVITWHLSWTPDLGGGRRNTLTGVVLIPGEAAPLFRDNAAPL